jgi:transposase
LAASLGSAAAKALPGEHLAGVLTSDRWSGEGWVPLGQRQVCWAPLARDWQGLVDRDGAAAPLGQRGVALTRDRFGAWHQFRRGDLDRAGRRAALQPVQDAFGRLPDDGMPCADAKAAGLCRALDRLWPALWTVADRDGVEPTNNAAERTRRPAVLWRKGRFGTQSDTGARFVERLLTVVATCKQHGRDVLAYLTAACTAALTGQAAPSLLPATAYLPPSPREPFRPRIRDGRNRIQAAAGANRASSTRAWRASSTAVRARASGAGRGWSGTRAARPGRKQRA